MQTKTKVSAIAVVRYRDEILLIKRIKKARYYPGAWEYPSGHMKEFEFAEKAAIREFKEETGLFGKIIRAGKTLDAVDKGIRWIILPFLINVKSKKVKINRKEHTEYKWVKLSEIKKFVKKNKCVPSILLDLKNLDLL